MNPTTRTTEYVYVIKETGTNFAKIGYSANPQARLCELQVGNPRILQIVALWEGGVTEEVVWHKRLEEFSGNGEWFCLPDCILRDLMRRSAKLDLPPAKADKPTVRHAKQTTLRGFL